MNLGEECKKTYFRDVKRQMWAALRLPPVIPEPVSLGPLRPRWGWIRYTQIQYSDSLPTEIAAAHSDNSASFVLVYFFHFHYCFQNCCRERQRKVDLQPFEQALCPPGSRADVFVGDTSLYVYANAQ